MTPTAEEAIKIIIQLPPVEKEKFFNWAEEEKNKELIEKVAKNNDIKEKDRKFRLALQWIEENKEEYDGQFVLLEGDKLIAFGKEAKPLYLEARKRGIEIPFVKRIKAIELPFGGW